MTLAATDKGVPVGDATVKVNDKEVGKTDARGEFVYEYKNLPKTGVTVTVRKTGYSTWHKTGELEPGRRSEVALSRRTLINVTALTEQYGYTRGVAGVVVTLDERPVGKTDDRGAYTFTDDGAPGKKVRLALSAPGHIPDEWKTLVTLEGQVNIQRYFSPATPGQIRVGVHRFAGNTLGWISGTSPPRPKARSRASSSSTRSSERCRARNSRLRSSASSWASSELPPRAGRTPRSEKRWT